MAILEMEDPEFHELILKNGFLVEAWQNTLGWSLQAYGCWGLNF